MLNRVLLLKQYMLATVSLCLNQTSGLTKVAPMPATLSFLTDYLQYPHRFAVERNYVKLIATPDSGGHAPCTCKPT